MRSDWNHSRGGARGLRGRTWMRAATRVVTLAVVLAATAAEGAEPPPFAQIEKLVRDHFSKQKIDARDLISKGRVTKVLSSLRRAGWTVRDADQIADSALPDGDFLVRELATPAGRKFMRQIGRYSNAFDRLDRLSRLPRGKQTVRDLIKGPDGYKLLEYLTTTQGGQSLGRQLSRSPKGRNFNRPTKRIYTVDDLIERLQQSYRAEHSKAPPR